jgi:hypothetical protein
MEEEEEEKEEEEVGYYKSKAEERWRRARVANFQFRSRRLFNIAHIDGKQMSSSRQE